MLQRLYLLCGLGLDRFQLGLLGLVVGRALGELRHGLLGQGLLALYAGGILFQAFLGQLDLQLLIFDLLGNGVELAVVAHVVLLLLVVAYHDLGLIDLALTLASERVELLDLGIDILDTSIQAGKFVFKILNLQRKFALYLIDLIDLRIDLLQLIQSHDLLVHRVVNVACLLLCHIL